MINADFQVRESEALAQLYKGSEWELQLEIQNSFSPSLSPGGAALMAIMSNLISIFATQQLILCFCTECSLHLEQLPLLLSGSLGQREFAFTLTRMLCELLHDGKYLLKSY